MDSIDKILKKRKVKDEEAVGGFAMDSFPPRNTRHDSSDTIPVKRKDGRQVIRTIYPESKVEPIPRRAMIDLDLTLHKYSKGYQDGEIYDGVFSGAKRVIDWLKRQGYEIVIFTTRASKANADELGGNHKEQIKKVAAWLNKHDIYFDKITAEKLAADFYIDDKAIHIPDGDWESVLKVIKKRVKYKVA